MIRRFNRERRGASAVEMAFAIPVFLMIVFGIFDYGRLFLVRHMMDSAAREAVRYACVNTSTATVAQVKAKADPQMGTVTGSLVGNTYTSDVFWIDANVSGGAKQYPFTAAPWGASVGVTIEANYRPIFRFVFGGLASINLKSGCYMLSEAN